MFNKPAFGSTTSGFGAFNSGTPATASPFGGFKPAANTSAFGGPPAFGAATQPTTGGLFGSSNTSGGLFGSTASTAAPTFGASSTGFGGFGATTSGGGLFGNTATSTGLFGTTQPNTAFGAKPAGFGFGQSSTAGSGGGLFGAPAASGGLFGQQPTQQPGVFAANTSTFGQQQAGTGHVKYNPVVGTDTVAKGGTTQSVNIKHHCITCMKEYENKSLEELRLEDYTAGRKGSTTGMFGFAQTEQKPLFGGTTSFGQPATTTASSVFGGGGLGSTGAFGQTSAFSFGNTAQNTSNTTGGLFGAAKPAFGATNTTGGGLFGATTTQAPTFGTSSAPAFGFGATTQNQQAGGVFGAKPATTGFGATPASTGFGGFGAGTTGGLFGAKPQQTTAPTFGSTTPAFGSLGTTGFGTSTTGSSLFGNNTFGKSATTQPTFGFSAPNNQLGGGLGGNTFQNKPAAPAFGSLGGGSIFQTPTNNAFSTGVDNSSGGMFNSSLGMGLGGLGHATAPTNTNLSGASAAGNVHEQILNLVARPYGDSPLFKDITADTPSSTEVLKPTNPAAMKAVLDSANNYRLTTSGARLKLHHNDKKSLFDGLEESDASLGDKLSLKPSRKRLVLRPKANSEVETTDSNQNRSREEPQSNANVNGTHKESETDRSSDKSPPERDRLKEKRDSNDNYSHDVESIADRHGSWLSATKQQWSAEKEKSLDNEPTPRLFPNLDKEIPIQISERRASWLTTKPLRKTVPTNPDSVENSVRELGVRSLDRSQDKENVDTFSVSQDEENVAPRPMPPHPTGVKLTRPGYYTIPSLDEMIKYMRADGSCVVPHLTIGRKNYGNVYYDCEIDVAGLDLDALVHFLNKEVTVYPDDSDKPPVGQGLNRRAVVTLDRIWPRDKTEKRPITDPDRLVAMDYEGKLRRVCDKHDTKFIEYRPQTGSWVFRVEHFSKYSLTDSDEEDDITPEVMKRQIVNQQLQKAAPIAPPKPIQPVGLGGLAAIGTPAFAPSGLGAPVNSSSTLGAAGASAYPPTALGEVPEHLYDTQIFTKHGKTFEMDTTEDNAESQSLYQELHRGYGVKSPTSELARLEHRQSHNVQLMKASLYTDTEMEDDASVSEDQTVPRGAPSRLLAPLEAEAAPISSFPQTHQSIFTDSAPTLTEELPMKPLIVRPHTIVLKYHRKVPPFKKTIAGGLDAACIADMSVCRARHSRVGFGPAGAMVFPTTYDAVSTLPNSAELCELGRYVCGRGDNDWSESAVVRIALPQPADKTAFLERMSFYLETLVECSDWHEAPDAAPRLCVKREPRARRQALATLAGYKSGALSDKQQAQFGVPSWYFQEVFQLCEALWGADLENDGVPGMDEASVVNRHKRLLQWMTAAVSRTTDEDLNRPQAPDPKDESDTHSGRVWALALGGRLAQACGAAAAGGDLHMAALLAQAAGDPAYRRLISRQLSLWRECGADQLMSEARWQTLLLLAGETAPSQLATADWLRALHATARYLCPPASSLETVVRTYEALFGGKDSSDQDPPNLATLQPDDVDFQLPLPPYTKDYDLTLFNNGSKRRVLDLRYELIRARAFNTRPKLHPQGYSPDPTDYSLCFVVGAWLGALGADGASVVGVAEQLEAAGAWHLAIQALLYHPDERARSHLVRGVLSRGAPARGGACPELRAVRRARLPARWLLTAHAHRAKYEHLPMVEVEHLIAAEQWNAAHKVLLEQLLPKAVLADELKSIAGFVGALSGAAARGAVSGWDAGGLAAHRYISVCHQVAGLVSGGEADNASDMEQLRALVALAGAALARLAAPARAGRLARTEMGARLVHLALAAGTPPHRLAALLKTLDLPPDTTYHATRKIATELADRAADLCLESADSSPASSKHAHPQTHDVRS